MKSPSLNWLETDSKLLKKCKLITKQKIEDVTTEEELILLRNDSNSRRDKHWENRQNASAQRSSDIYHHLWEIEDLVSKLLTDCIHELFPE